MASLDKTAAGSSAGQTPGPWRKCRLRAASPGVFLPLLLVGFVVVGVRCAWVTDDAYIMFRTIDNLLHGHGLTWNVTERVQVYTCPLWMFCLTSVIALTGEFFHTTVAVSLVVTVAALGLIAYRVAPGKAAAVLALCALTFSKGFVDFSTSGLENPLSHLLLVVYCLSYFRLCGSAGASPSRSRSLFLLTLLAALGMLNRLDTSLFYLPSLAWMYWQAPKGKGTLAVLLGMLPVLVWEAFSLWYYGFPFPNTAYAKLNLGIPQRELMIQGLHYYANALRMDPLALLVIAAGMLAPLVGRKWSEVPLALGVGLYLLYVVKIGGDFMSMRFFTAPLVVSVILLCRCPFVQGPRVALACGLLLLAVSWWSPRCPLCSGRCYGTRSADEVDQWGIADERGFYFPILGMRRSNTHPHPQARTLNPVALERDRKLNRGKAPEVVWTYNAGVLPFRDGERIYFLDRLALGDPLLARLPAVAGPWRIGHFERFLPDGYLESLNSGRDVLADPNLAAYYDKLKLVVSGDLWSWERLRAIWELNTGQLDHLIDYGHYRRSGSPPGQPATAQRK
jgi:arabinofuranosyltransferase